MSDDLNYDADVTQDSFDVTDGAGDIEQTGVTGWDGEVVPYQEDATFTTFEYGPGITFVDSDYNSAWNHAVIDVDGDGAPEVVASVQGEGVIVMVDAEGDGEFEESQFLTYDELQEIQPELADLLSPENGFEVPEAAAFQPVQIDAATTATESPYWFEQAANGLCVPASVAQIVSEYSGVTFESEAEFVELANEYGLFSVGPDGVPGVTAEGALFLMEQAGVPASMIVSADLSVLDSYLDSGHGVVISVDSGEVWHGEGSGSADHALVVEEIDQESGVAILSDPGNPEGNGYTMPLSDFEEAWAAGGNTMIVADQPATGVDGVDTTVFETEPETALRPVPEMAGALTSHGTADGPDLGTDTIGETDIQLHNTPAEVIAAVVRRAPWILLPVAIGIRSLTSRNR